MLQLAIPQIIYVMRKIRRADDQPSDMLFSLVGNPVQDASQGAAAGADDEAMPALSPDAFTEGTTSVEMAPTAPPAHVV